MPVFSSLLKRCQFIALIVLASTFVSATPALADPPGRIGRIAWFSGNVFLNNPTTGEANIAPLNQPLTSGDILSTDPGARAEIQIGSMTVRLDTGSTIELARINDEEVRLYLRNGRSIVKLPTPDAINDFELATQNGRFSARESGIYRFESDANGSSATAYFGTLHFSANDTAFDIGGGQRAQFWYSGRTGYRLLAASGDDFSQWSAARDQRQRTNTTNSYSRYVSPEMTGAQDLDAYGDWSESPEYGAIWTPRGVAAGWAPYRSGQWVWIEPWGWTWVGNEPWGFAPFHYGRWVQFRGMWSWVPGNRIARPVYAPAMVAWIGTPGVGVSLSIGAQPSVGWFPLAPHEVYVPIYRTSPNYVRNINITHVPHIPNVANIVRDPHAVIQHSPYTHREQPQAVSIVPADAFNRHRSAIPAAPFPGKQRDLRDQSMRTSPSIVPTPRAAFPNETRFEPQIRQAPQERPAQPFTHRDQSPQAPEYRHATQPMAAPALPTPAPPVATPQRIERPAPEIQRPLPQARPETSPPRNQEQPARREETVIRSQPREIRNEPPAARQAPPPVRMEAPAPRPEPRYEAPAQVNRPPEPRSEPRVERREEKREDRQNQGHRRDETEKR